MHLINGYTKGQWIEALLVEGHTEQQKIELLQ